MLIGRRSVVICPARHDAASPKNFAVVKAKRSFGQNFLIDEVVASRIAGEASLTAQDSVLEIGPEDDVSCAGTGNLTVELLKRGAKVTAIEADRTLLPGLEARFEEERASGQLEIVEGDATRVNLTSLLTLGGRHDRKWKVVANLPFNITTTVLKTLLPMGEALAEVLVMLQLEAAERLTGSQQSSAKYRAMSVLVGFYSTASLGMRINRTAFHPSPHVDCAMARFKLKPPAERLVVPSEEALLRLVNICFSARRKTLKKSLTAVFDARDVQTAMEKLGLESNARPQELQVENFAALCRELL